MRYILLLWSLFVLAGCNSMKIEDFSDKAPRLVLEDYFKGKTYAWGVFEDRFGSVRRQFQVEIDGRWDGETLTLEEYFLYDDGEEDKRTWVITKWEDGHYTGVFGDIVGEARGQVRGNALNWVYTMDLPVGDNIWRVKFDDWMFWQPGDVIINRAVIKKWGFELGTVTLFFTRERMLQEIPFSLAPASK
ncbi:DUF3833 domain-containing protein [Oceanospirillum linum]|uniref:DUF3833 domain-containing protein n=1 Tax=Oceanospirillum linum TaxID=966 RepID=A0A1T1HE08_OCELI|nr:DUF3833 domain-containing protein [Oceanospirillum linum]OOV88042.1 hypothetical protein BTA35_0200310 [Oceanospirillum linum]SEF41137.1 Protein of unknown function [Oleiphilus messinensis]SMP00612.1 Protein of unknown function [Oceanospirillum linum]